MARTSRRVVTDPTLMPKSCRVPPAKTKLPIPCRVVTSPAAWSWEIASRTTVRLTPCWRTISDSGGSFAPGASAPVSIKFVRRPTTCCVKFLDGFLPFGPSDFIPIAPLARDYLRYYMTSYNLKKRAESLFTRDFAAYDIVCQEVFVLSARGAQTPGAPRSLWAS
jgi:hypothetical protein